MIGCKNAFHPELKGWSVVCIHGQQTWQAIHMSQFTALVSHHRLAWQNHWHKTVKCDFWCHDLEEQTHCNIWLAGKWAVESCFGNTCELQILVSEQDTRGQNDICLDIHDLAHCTILSPCCCFVTKTTATFRPMFVRKWCKLWSNHLEEWVSGKRLTCSAIDSLAVKLEFSTNAFKSAETVTVEVFVWSKHNKACVSEVSKLTNFGTKLIWMATNCHHINSAIVRTLGIAVMQPLHLKNGNWATHFVIVCAKPSTTHVHQRHKWWCFAIDWFLVFGVGTKHLPQLSACLGSHLMCHSTHSPVSICLHFHLHCFPHQWHDFHMQHWSDATNVWPLHPKLHLGIPRPMTVCNENLPEFWTHFARANENCRHVWLKFCFFQLWPKQGMSPSSICDSSMWSRICCFVFVESQPTIFGQNKPVFEQCFFVLEGLACGMLWLNLLSYSHCGILFACLGFSSKTFFSLFSDSMAHNFSLGFCHCMPGDHFMLVVGDSLWWKWLGQDTTWLWLERDQVE